MFRPVLLVLLLSSFASAESLRVISWNIESGGADPAIIARQLGELPSADAYLLQEVAGRDIGRLAAAIRKKHGPTFKYYISSLGGSDRLAIIIDESKYRIRSFSELFSFGEYQLNDWNHRPPLVAHLVQKESGQELLLVTVHLARGNARLRTEQATGLREWARTQELPVILAGDCNFDYDFHKHQGNKAYAAFFSDAVWKEVVPETRIDSNWADRNGDGKDDYPNSCLDFAAVAASGSKLTSSSRIIVREGDFPDTKATSDHRPLFLALEIE